VAVIRRNMSLAVYGPLPAAEKIQFLKPMIKALGLLQLDVFGSKCLQTYRAPNLTLRSHIN
jgi:hypothetical protein